jgi:hypothetical protein
MNNIELSTIFLPLLDELYQQECKTSIFEGDETTVKKGKNGEIKIAVLDMDGLGDFSRNDGYTKGSTHLRWETIKYDKERSQDLRIDRLDEDESLNTAFTNLAGEFIRTKVIPETDAARIAKLCSTEGISKKSETLADGEAVVKALRAASSKMDEDEVPTESRILLITPTNKGLVDDLDTTKSKKVLEKFATIIEVPQARMISAITLNDGTESYGFKKAEGAKNVNFVVVEKKAYVCALQQFIKYFDPDSDQEGDSHVFKYRNNNLYGHCYENKLAGIYASISEE